MRFIILETKIYSGNGRFWKRKFILETGLGFVILETAVSGNENLFWKRGWVLFFWKRPFPETKIYYGKANFLNSDFRFWKNTRFWKNRAVSRNVFRGKRGRFSGNGLCFWKRVVILESQVRYSGKTPPFFWKRGRFSGKTGCFSGIMRFWKRPFPESPPFSRKPYTVCDPDIFPMELRSILRLPIPSFRL